MKSKSARGFIVGLVLTLMLLMSISVAAEKTTLTVYIPGNNVGLYAAYGVMAKDAAASLGYDVEIVTAGTWVEYLEKIAIHEASDVPVDIILGDDVNFALKMSAGLFKDLSPLVKADNVDLNQFFPMSVQIKRYKAQLMAIPVNVGINTLYYNVDLLANLGLGDLPHDWNTTRWEWADFVTTVRKATADLNGDGLMDRVGLARWTHSIDPWQWGTDFVDAAATRANLLDPQLGRALQESLKLYTEYSAIPGLLSHVDKSVPSKSSFYMGKALMMPGLDADAGGFAAQVLKLGNGSKIDTTVFPRGTERHTAFNSWGWAIGTTTQNEQAAWAVIKKMTLDAKFLVDNVASVNRLPALKTAAGQAVRYLQQSAPIDWQVMIDALSSPTICKFNSWYFNNNGVAVNTMINTILSDITSGKKSVAQALGESQEPLDYLLKTGAW